MGEEPKDIFEKIFGKKPASGFIFKHLDVTFGWRAIIIKWSAQGIGFGELTFIFDKDNGLVMDIECMDDEFIHACVSETITRLKAKEIKPLVYDPESVASEDEPFGKYKPVDISPEFFENMFAVFIKQGDRR